MHFEECSAVHKSLHKITARLNNELKIPYAVVGGMALFAHGVRRFTDHVDLLVTPVGLKEAHERLDGLGCIPPSKGSKQLRDSETGVRIEFLVTGQFPGDGKEKSVAFPDAVLSSTEIEGIRFLRLENLVELRPASGMTNPGRLKDLADVQEIVKVLKLSRSFGERVHEYVRPKFLEMWDAVQGSDPQE